MPGNRKSTRLKEYDYSHPGAYYVTVCADDRRCVFGSVRNGDMILNDAGRMVEFTWKDLPRHNGNIKLDEFVIMPNHVHGIIVIVGAGSQPALKCDRAGLEPAPTDHGLSGPAIAVHGLSEIVRQFKTFSARRVNQMKNTPGIRLWQRDYYEHVIRDESDLAQIREYIVNNPLSWIKDEYYSA